MDHKLDNLSTDDLRRLFWRVVLIYGTLLGILALLVAGCALPNCDQEIVESAAELDAWVARCLSDPNELTFYVLPQVEER